MIDFTDLGQHAENSARANLQRNNSLQNLLDEFLPDSRVLVERLLIVSFVAGYGQALTDNQERIAPLTLSDVDELAQALRSQQ